MRIEAPSSDASDTNTPFSQNAVAARSSAANVRVGNAEHLVGTAAIRRRPQSVSKKLNMFNFCRRLLRWILHRVDTVVLPQTPCLYRVCTAEYRGVVHLHFCHQFLVLHVYKRSSQQPLPDPKLLGLTSSCPSICFVSCISCLQFVQLQNSISLNS